MGKWNQDDSLEKSLVLVEEEGCCCCCSSEDVDVVGEEAWA